MAGSNTQRTLEAFKFLGYRVGMVERELSKVWRPGGGRGIKQDLFHILDIIALNPERGKTIGVQSTGQDYRGHDRKLLYEQRQNSIDWLMSGNGLELWAWRKILKKKGGKQKIWVPRVKIYTLKDF